MAPQPLGPAPDHSLRSTFASFPNSLLSLKLSPPPMEIHFPNPKIYKKLGSSLISGCPPYGKSRAKEAILKSPFFSQDMRPTDGPYAGNS